MKRNKLWAAFSLAYLLAFLPVFGAAANTCTRTDFECYQSGPSQNLNTQWRIDATGNVTSAGNLTANGNLSVLGQSSFTGQSTVSGLSIYPSQFVNVSTTTAITPTSTYILLNSTGSAVVLNGGSGNAAGGPYPAISTATIANGTYIVLGTTTSASGFAVTLTSGTGSGLDLGSATRVIGFGKQIGLIYNSTQGQWLELYYGSN